MKHTYLSQEKIIEALAHHCITEQEASELRKDLDRCKELDALIKLQEAS